MDRRARDMSLSFLCFCVGIWIIDGSCIQSLFQALACSLGCKVDLVISRDCEVNDNESSLVLIQTSSKSEVLKEFVLAIFPSPATQPLEHSVLSFASKPELVTVTRHPIHITRILTDSGLEYIVREFGY